MGKLSTKRHKCYDLTDTWNAKDSSPNKGEW